MTTSAALAGVRVLLTRPAAQAEQWLATLRAQGAVVEHIPTLEIVQAVAPVTLSHSVAAAHIGIFVSTNAVQALQAALHSIGQTPQGLAPRWYCVGSTTAALARQLGFDVVDCAAHNSESLLASLPSVAGQVCLIVRGHGGRQLMGDALLAAGATVNYCELYRRQCAWQNQPALVDYLSEIGGRSDHIIAISSVETLEFTLSMAAQANLGDIVKRSSVLVPGARVAAAAQAAGIERIVTAPTMALTDIVYALENWWTTQQ